MEKYGAVFDDELSKTAEVRKISAKLCPECFTTLTQPNHCPNCGTKPFEKRPEPDTSK